MLRLKFMQDAMKNRSHQLEDLISCRTQELSLSRLQIIWKLAKAAEFRDEETGEHVVRVARTSAQIALQLGLSRAKVAAIYMAAPLHDIGKIGIPDSILLKPGALTKKEQKIMRRHCELGFKILSEPGRAESSLKPVAAIAQALAPDATMSVAQEVALSHHECWDGSGYPRGLAGEEIPLAARIVTVADVYDALRSSRPYKFPVAAEDAIGIIEQGRGRQFDAEVVDAFLQCCRAASVPENEFDRSFGSGLPDTADVIRLLDMHSVAR
jgi:putative two-component system response regulator